MREARARLRTVRTWRRRRCAIVVVGAAAGLALSSCGSSSSSTQASSTAGPATGGKQIRVGLAQTTSQNDGSFGEAAHDGAAQAERALGIKLTEVDSLATPAQQLTALENLARGSNLVLMDASVSPQGIYQRYPATVFVNIGGSLPEAKNTRSTVEDWYPVSYLAGVAAAVVSKRKVIGFVGGVPVPVVRDAAAGYALGARSVDPSIQVRVTYIGSFTDAAEAKSAAQAQIADGAGVLYADLDTAHAGVVQAAKAAGARVIGSVDPKCSISDGTDIGDTVFNEQGIVFGLIRDFVRGRLAQTTRVGLSGDVSAFVPCPGASSTLTAALAKARAQILAGKVKLPESAGAS